MIPYERTQNYLNYLVARKLYCNLSSFSARPSLFIWVKLAGNGTLQGARKTKSIEGETKEMNRDFMGEITNDRMSYVP